MTLKTTSSYYETTLHAHVGTALEEIVSDRNTIIQLDPDHPGFRTRVPRPSQSE